MRGFCAETGGAIAFFVATGLGIPATALIAAIFYGISRVLF